MTTGVITSEPSPDWRGSTLAADAASGATVLSVDDTIDFDDDDTRTRWLVVGESAPLEYVALDDEADTVTLAAPTTEAFEAGLPVVLWDPTVAGGGAKVVEYLAPVRLSDDSGTVDAVVPHELIPLNGIANLVGAQVGLFEDDGEWYVGQVYGREAVLDGSSIDPDTLPIVTEPPTDGLAPTVATTVTALGGIGSMFYRWTAVDNADPVTYRLHVRADADPTTDGTYEVASGVGLTFAAVRALADGTAVVADGTVTYHAIVTVEDADGPGPASTAATGVPAQVNSPDIAANAITVDLLAANDAVVEVLEGKTLTGTTIQTRGDQNAGIKLGIVTDEEGNTTEGFWVYDSAGAPFLTAVPDSGMAIVAGEGKFRSVTVAPTTPEDGTSLGGTTEVTRNPDGTAGVLRFTAYTTPPRSAPIVSSTYDTIQFEDDGLWQDRRGLATDGTNWFTTRTYVIGGTLGGPKMSIEKWDAAGNFVDTQVVNLGIGSASASPPDTGGIAYHGGYVYTLTRPTRTASWSVDKWDASTFLLADSVQWGGFDDGNKDPAIGIDPATGDILIAQARPTNGDRVRVRRYTISGTNLVAGAFVDADFAYDNDLCGIFYGAADIGTNRYIYTTPGSSFAYRVMSTGGTRQQQNEWPAGMDADKVGFTYSGSNFYSIDTNGRLQKYTNLTTNVTSDPNMTKWVANTLANASAETTMSPRAWITLAKRSKLRVDTSAINSGGTNAPNRVRIYVGQGATDPGRTGLWKQTDPATGATSIEYEALVTSGTNPPSTNGFQALGGTVQRLEDASGTAFFDGVSGGDAWSTYVPTFTAASTNPTLANFTVAGRYARIGRKTIAFSIVITCNAGSGFGAGTYSFGLPVAARALNEVIPSASQSGPNRVYIGRNDASTTSFILNDVATNAGVNATNSGMASGTVLRISGTYEAA